MAQKKTGSTSAPTVSSFMSQVLLTLPGDLPLADAAQFFASHKLTTVPVIGPNEIYGVLTDFQLLRFLLRAKKEAKYIPIIEFEDELDPVITIGEDESIVNAFRLMIQSPNHRIYTLKEGKLTGALSPKDLLLYLAGVRDKSDQIIDAIVQKQIESILKELQDTRKLLNDYQKMFNDSPYLMHSVDMRGQILAANRMLHAVLGYKEGELIGKSIRQLYPPENHRVAMQGLETVRALGFHPMVNATMVKKNGEVVRVDIATTLKEDEEGNPSATITVGRLSDSYRMVNYLQRAAKAQDSSRKLRKPS